MLPLPMMAVDRKRLVKPLRKLRKLIRKLDRAPRPEDVHDLRTSARRAESAFEALSLNEQETSKSVIKDLRRCHKRAGKVRDMDVLTGYASKVHVEGEEECAVELLECLGARRQNYAKKLYAEVRRVSSGLRRNLKRMSALVADLAEANGHASEDTVAVSHAAGSAVTLAVQLGAPEHLNRGNLHAYRLKVKKLQNVLKMAGGDNTFASDLAKTKDAIGEWHDWEELAGIAEKELEHRSGCRFVSELKRISQSKYDHALQAAETLRGKYLGNPDGPKSSGILRLPVWEAIARLAA